MDYYAKQELERAYDNMLWQYQNLWCLIPDKNHPNPKDLHPDELNTLLLARWRRFYAACAYYASLSAKKDVHNDGRNVYTNVRLFD